MTGEIEYRFRHKIGDALYDLYSPDAGEDETIMYPIVRRTDRYVYVYRCGWRDAGRLMRFSVDDLERDGRAWNEASGALLRVRPMPHWPFMPAEIRVPEPLPLDHVAPALRNGDH